MPGLRWAATLSPQVAPTAVWKGASAPAVDLPAPAAAGVRARTPSNKRRRGGSFVTLEAPTRPTPELNTAFKLNGAEHAIAESLLPSTTRRQVSFALGEKIAYAHAAHKRIGLDNRYRQ